jgi:hypothetical protein
MPFPQRCRSVCSALLLYAASSLTSEGVSSPSFRNDIAPVLQQRCVTCHGPEKEKGSYRLDTYERLLIAGDSEQPPITAGDPERSHLFHLVTTSDPVDRMPQDGEALAPTEIEMLRSWITAGAPFDGDDPRSPLTELTATSPFPAPPPAYAFPVPITAAHFTSHEQVGVGGFREITLWSTSGELQGRISGLPERIHALVKATDHRLFFAGGTPGRLGAVGRVDLNTGATPEILMRTADELLALAVAGDLLATGGADRTITLLGTADRSRVRQWTTHADWVLDLAFSPDGKWLVSASRDQTARVFEIDSGALTASFREHNQPVTAVTFLEEGKRVASAGRDGRIRTWDTQNAKAGKSSQRWPGEATCLLEHDGTLWSSWNDGHVRALNTPDLKLVKEWRPGRDPVLELIIQPEADLIAAATQRGQVHLWKLASGDELPAFTAAPMAGTASP